MGIHIRWDEVAAKFEKTAFTYAILTLVAIPTVHASLHRLVFTPAGKYLVKLKDPKKTDDDQTAKYKKLLKFQESAWKCVAYMSLAAASGYALSHETFWKDTAEFWTDCSVAPCEYEPTPSMQFSYALDMAYYSYAIPYLILFETKRKDFVATLSHHIVTVALIAYSYALGFTKVGVVVMFLHDICDFPLEIAKMARYAGNDFLTNLFFGLFTLIWIVMRDIYYPLWVIYSVCIEAPAHFMSFVHTPGVKAWDYLAPHWQIFAGMLIFLWILHLYWTKVILGIAIGALSNGAAEDTREDEDED